ncbi:MAG: class I tRNA ligase family protein, partial [Gammaproteobacteria bacterium]
DTVRLFMMFASPPDQSLEWSDSGVEGGARFLKRLWKFARDNYRNRQELDRDTLTDAQRELRRKIHQTIAKVNDDIGRRYTFNTAIAAVMELINALTRSTDDSANGEAIRYEGLKISTLLLSPIVPHITDDIWRHLGHDQAIIDAPWPTADETTLQQERFSLVIQVNGKKRAEISAATDTGEEELTTLALADENVQRYITGKQTVKTIVVPGRLINIVVK